MKITLVQQDIAWGDRKQNLHRIEEMVETAARDRGTDLYVLPEMFTTGFATSADSKLDEDPSATVEWMKTMAKKYDAAFTGSVAMGIGNGKNANRMYFVTPEGKVSWYDKHHLFTYGEEHERFTAGKERVIVEWRGVKFLLLVCYDLRFPVWARNRGDYDGIVICANWPLSRQKAWETLLRARAIENQAFVAAVNRVGVDPSCQYIGGSVLLNAYGDDICRCEDDLACTESGIVDIKEQNTYKQKFTAIGDGDKFEIL